MALAAIAFLCGAAVLTFALTRPPQTSEVRGLLVDVQSRDITHVESVTVREADGTVYVFVTSQEVTDNPEQPITASHLRQHLTGGIPVVVRYRAGPNGLVALRIFDSDVSGPP